MAPQIKSIFPNLKQHITPTASGSTVVSYTSDIGGNGPILTLIHGYPQSAFIWRHVVPALIDKVSLFVPELPGYGVSSPANDNSKTGIGSALLEALKSTFGLSEETPRKVILGGHDRGARISHRLAVSKNNFKSLDVIGAILMDIIPTKSQWDNFSDPAICAGYFHWPLLANIDFAVKMISAYGGAQWCRDCHTRITGTNEIGQKRVQADNAIEVYAANFDKEETLRYTCEDYASGASPEYKEQAEDQENGRKIEVPTIVLFSKAKLGSRQDVAKIWEDWIAPGVEYQGIGIGNGHGHYLPEEACDEVTDHIISFLEKHT